MSRENEPLWMEAADDSVSGDSPLQGDLETDVVIVGAGITGLTAALHLLEEGRRVVIVEKDSLASGESGRTTAHLTEVIDASFQTLRRDFGEEGARLAAQASREAIETVARWIGTFSIDCGFTRLPAFMYAEDPADVDWLRQEAEASRAAGLDAQFTSTVPLPFPVRGAVRYENQAQFHPLRYLQALGREITKRGGTIATGTPVREVHDGEPCTVLTDGGTIRARAVIVAANVPVNNRLFLHTKIAAYRSYAIAAEVRPDFLPAGLYWDTEDPYHYTRLQEIDGRHWIIVGGCDHKTGTHRHTEDAYEELIAYAQSRFGIGEPQYRWSGQIIEPDDGLPFIGRNSASRHVFIATGYAGQGMTFGTFAGRLTADLVLGRESEYAALFDATRVKPVAAAKDFLRENVDYPKYLLAQHLSSFDVEGDAVAQVAPGEGKILELDGRKVAAFRAESGQVHLLSPVCPHMFCDVRFNHAEKTWDCPCHGSRFSGEGRVINGPSTKDLAPATDGRAEVKDGA